MTPALPPAAAPPTLPIGRTFFHPAVDYLLIGGLASVPFVALVGFDRALFPTGVAALIAVVLVNYAHFAASTVRLYTRPGLARSIPWVAWGFPVVWAVLMGVALVWADLFADHFWALYQSWSPYHYAAQTFGIAMMYTGRSGVKLAGSARRWLWWTCMLPFLWAFFSGANEAGLAWFVDLQALAAVPWLGGLHTATTWLLGAAALLLPLAFFATAGRRMPLIAVALVATNALWWLTLSYDDAWTWAALAHGIQYLLVVGIFDARDHAGDDGPQLRRGLGFYGLCVVLGVILFMLLPAGVSIGAGIDFDVTIKVLFAGIILHHFIVDGFIWKRKRVGVGG